MAKKPKCLSNDIYPRTAMGSTNLEEPIQDMIKDGASNREIIDELGCSLRYIKRQRRILKGHKLGEGD